MATPQKVSRRIPQAGGKRADYVRRFRRAQMAGMYVPVGGRANASQTDIVRPAFNLDPSRVRDRRGMDPVADGPFWDLRRAAYNLAQGMFTEGAERKNVYMAQQRAGRVAEANRPPARASAPVRVQRPSSPKPKPTGRAARGGARAI